MIEYLVNAHNVQESNEFLRKLWCELNSIHPLGWIYSPYRENTKLFIGESNLGSISFSYTQKGCIEYIYIDEREPNEKTQILTALKKATDNKFSRYLVWVNLSDDEKHSLNGADYGNISIIESQEDSILCFPISAYSDWDLKEMLKLKIPIIISILFEYTLTLYKVSCVTFSPHLKSQKDPLNTITEYDYNWMDSSDMPISNTDRLILPADCIQMINCILNDNYTDRRLNLLINSSKIISTANSLYVNNYVSPYQVPGVSETIISLAVSSFEPLACINNDKKEFCDACGNMKYSIVSKVKELISKYYSEEYARLFVKQYYQLRSSFFHEGIINRVMVTDKCSYPLIDPVLKTQLINHNTAFDLKNLTELSAYIFRAIVHEYFSL